MPLHPQQNKQQQKNSPSSCSSDFYSLVLLPLCLRCHTVLSAHSHCQVHAFTTIKPSLVQAENKTIQTNLFLGSQCQMRSIWNRVGLAATSPQHETLLLGWHFICTGWGPLSQVGLVTTVQAPMMVPTTHAALQWEAAGGSEPKGREPREEIRWYHSACWVAVAGHQMPCYCQVSVGVEEERAAWKGLWEGEETMFYKENFPYVKNSRGESAHLLESATSGLAVSLISLTPLHFFFSSLSVSYMSWSHRVKMGNTFSRAEADALALCESV